MRDKSEQDHLADTRTRLIEAALGHVVFDGWSTTTLNAAIAASGVDAGLAHLAFPRGGIDMALGFHRMMDGRLAAELATLDTAEMRIRERVTHAVRRRIELVAEHREAVRRGATLLALPHYAPEGARAVWETADTIWTGLGDRSRDYNWYTKRAILSSVYSTTVLYWLGDESMGFSNSWAFLDRRIENVMQFEKLKAGLRGNPLIKAAFWAPSELAARMRAPAGRKPEPGRG